MKIRLLLLAFLLAGTSAGRAAETGGMRHGTVADVEKEYQRLRPLWEIERKKFSYSSNTYDYWKGPSGKAITALGPAILPTLIRELRKGDFFFNVPVATITGIDIKAGKTISEQEAAKLWLAWWDSSALPH